MPKVRTPRYFPGQSMDEPFHTPRACGVPLTPTLGKPRREILVTPKHLGTPTNTAIPITPSQGSAFHEFGHEEVKGSKAPFFEGDHEAPSQMFFVNDYWKHGITPTLVESPGFQDPRCEEPTGFKTSAQGDQEILAESVTIDDQWKHGTCMSATMKTSGFQDSGCKDAPSFNTSLVEVDALCIQIPGVAESSGVGSDGTFNSAWMQNLQKRNGPQIDDSRKYGLPICMSASTVIAGTTIACALQYAVLPNVNPIRHQDRRGWWYCPLNCTLIWMPNCIAYIGIMLDQFVFAGTGVRLTYLDLFLLWLVGSIVMDFFLTFLSLAPPWYPFPLGSLIAAPSAFTSIAIVFGLCMYPRLRRAVPKHEARKIAVKTLLVFVIFVWSICLLLLLLLLLALLNRIGSDSLKVLVVLFVGSLREACRAGTQKVAVLLHPEAAIIGQNLAMACFGVGLTMIVGSSSSVLLTGVILLQDILRGMIVGIMIGNVFVGQFNLSLFLVQLQPLVWFKLCIRRRSSLQENEVEQEKATLKSNLIATETGEVILPIAYLCSWLVVRVGPYSSSFTGIGTKDYGIEPPEKINSFVMFTSVLIVFEALSVMILKISLRYFVRIHISFDDNYSKFGKLLTGQNTWVVHTCFCVSMISCGFDYSLQWESPQK